MSLDQAIHGAVVGGAIGFIAGLVPLGIGHYCREKRKGVQSFLACAVAGAIGGTYAAIAIMAASSASIIWPQSEVERPKNEWSGLESIADKAWYLLGFAWLLLSMLVTMIVSAGFLTPLVLGVSNCEPRDSTGNVVEVVMLFGGLLLGIVLGLLGMSLISRRFISAATHENWAKAFESSTLNRSPLLRRVGRYYYELLLPRNWQWSKEP